VIVGYTGDYTNEWATLVQKAAAWLNLAFRNTDRGLPALPCPPTWTGASMMW
jgi:hypothetical protein